MNPRPGRLVLLGHPVGHSLSPRMQNAALRQAGIPLEYEALDVAPAGLPATLAALRSQGGAGNVTIPHKRAVWSQCARLTEEAERVGAVNTFWHDDAHELVGDNTDVAGFAALARHVFGEVPAGVAVVVLGAGGGAAAVCAATGRWPSAAVSVVGRSPDRAQALADRFAHVRAVPAGELARTLAAADVVVNATPIGLDDERHPAPLDRLRGDAVVMDLVYRRGETAWVRAARERGHRAADGLEMLIAQGAHAFERWFGFAPDVAAMRAAVAA